MSHDTSYQQCSVAVFIDADNVSSHYIADVMQIAKKYGKIIIKRVYANWSKPSMSSWRDVCTEHALNAIQQFDHVVGKNASDMAVSVDAMDILHRQNISVFCLVSGDSDFTPLCTKLREYDKTVIGFGAKNSSKSLVNACHEFHYLVKEKEHTPPPPVVHNPVDAHEAKHRPNPNHDKRLVSLIESTIKNQGVDGLLNTATLGQALRTHNPNFSPLHYGYAKIGDMLSAMGMFETVLRGSTLFVGIRQNQSRPTQYLSTPSTEKVQSALSPEGLLADTVLTNALSNAVALLQEPDGWATIEKVQDYLNHTFGIISQNYGYNNIVELIKNLSTLFDTRRQLGIWYVQDKRTQTQEAPKAAPQETIARHSPAQLRKNSDLCQALKEGIAISANDKGWAALSSVGTHFRNLGFSPKDYGYRNLTELIKAINIFDIATVGSVHTVKDPTAKANKKPSTPPENTKAVDTLTAQTATNSNTAENTNQTPSDDKDSIQPPTNAPNNVRFDNVQDLPNDISNNADKAANAALSDDVQTDEISENIQADNPSDSAQHQGTTSDTASANAADDDLNNLTATKDDLRQDTQDIAQHTTLPPAKTESTVVENTAAESTATNKKAHSDITEQLVLLLSETDDEEPQSEEELSISEALTLVIKELLDKGKAVEDDWVKVSDVSGAMKKAYDIKVSSLGFATFAELLADLPEFATQKQGRIWLTRLI